MRLVIGRKVDLAIRALRTLEGADGLVPAAAIAQSAGTTTSFLPQVMAPLVAAGWVTSERGPGGGYRLTARLPEVSVLDVVTAIEGPIPDGTCVLRGGPCGGVDVCSLHGAWSSARGALVAELAGTPVG